MKPIISRPNILLTPFSHALNCVIDKNIISGHVVVFRKFIIKIESTEKMNEKNKMKYIITKRNHKTESQSNRFVLCVSVCGCGSSLSADPTCIRYSLRSPHRCLSISECTLHRKWIALSDRWQPQMENAQRKRYTSCNRYNYNLSAEQRKTKSGNENGKPRPKSLLKILCSSNR